jgi:hypothetical protein
MSVTSTHTPTLAGKVHYVRNAGRSETDLVHAAGTKRVGGSVDSVGTPEGDVKKLP